MATAKQRKKKVLQEEVEDTAAKILGREMVQLQ